MIFDIEKDLGGREVVLASKSPRRQELLKLLFRSFTIVPALGEEIVPEDVPAAGVSEVLARQKCREVAAERPEALVIGCDTTVVLGSEILGKPENAADAARMLRELSGSTHEVISGVCISLGGEERSFSEHTKVKFRILTDAEISAYIATGEPMDKAGAYGIQEKGSLLAEGIEGDFFNVVGLPVTRLGLEIERLLRGDK